MIKNPYKIITHLTNNVSFKFKIIAIFFAFIIIPMSIFTFIVYKRIYNLVLTQTLNTASMSFKESTAIMDKYIENMNGAMQNILFDSDIYDIASTDSSGYTPLNQLKDYDMLMRRFNYLKSGTDVDNIRLYLFGDYYYSGNNNNIFRLSDIINDTWYKKLRNTYQNRLWCPPALINEADALSPDYFSYAGLIYNKDNLGKPLAVIRVDIESEKVAIALKDAAVTQNSVVYLSDGIDVLLSNIDLGKTPLGNVLSTSSKDFLSDEWKYHQIDGQTYIVKAEILNLAGWYTVYVIPKRDISALSNRIGNEMTIILLLISSLSYFLAYIISNSSLKRLFLLNREMKKIESGNLNVHLKQIGSDEIGELMGSFNLMTTRMKDMINRQYILGQEIKSAELKALQAQINPHFLYNSLDLVNCLAIRYNITEITQMVTSLAKFYKLSLSQGNDVIPIKDELMHVQFYVQIQNLRFENSITLIMDIEETIYQYYTIKTILQPIIENSILHGILEKEEKSGIIKISGVLENELITLNIEDDGVGMPEETVTQILVVNKSNSRHGYGVKNTNDRIKLYYGDKYGLSYSSVLGKGTTVKIKLPACKNE